MKSSLHASLEPLFSFALFITITLAATPGVNAQPEYRRGTSATNALPRYEFYVVDSDDNAPNAPSSNFIDTTYGTWTRILSTGTIDDQSESITTFVPNSIPFYSYQLALDTTNAGHLRGLSVSSNGVIAIGTSVNTPNNVALPSAVIDTAMFAPLWADWEVLNGDGSRVMYRSVVDTEVISFYKLALKGTDGQVRATFQIVFSIPDSTILYNYKSFTGSYNGVSASALIQRLGTIGMQSPGGGFGITYLHKGNYYAANPNPTYNRPLHDGLSIKFYTEPRDAFAVTNITFPPYDRYELTTNTITPSFSVFNSTDTTVKIFFHTSITNTATNSTAYNRFDSLSVASQTTGTFTGSIYNGIGCGSYKESVTITYRGDVSDAYAANNTAVRYFSVLSTQSLPFREEFTPSFSTCAWTSVGGEIVNGLNLFFTAPGPMTGGQNALLMNRLNTSGVSFAGNSGGDTLTSAPINLSGQSNVNVMFHYQRGLKTDTSAAGITNRVLSGPELQIANHAGGYVELGDSLIVEGLLSSGSTWNPTSASWSRLGAIPGGFDVNLQTFQVKLGTSFLHNHFRLRLRVKAADNSSFRNLFEDADNFLVDEIHVEQLQSNKTELEPVDVDFGNGIYTHVPRDLSKGLIPRVRIRNNGDGVTLGLSLLHLVIKDELNRPVYDKISAFSFPQPLADSLFPMQAWDLHGSQGGPFTVRVSIEQPFYDTYLANDTDAFVKTMYIDDTYALDDGQADTVGTQVSPSSNFTYDFTPLGDDSLRGAEFYYTASSGSSSWTLVATWGQNTATRTFLLSPIGPGFYRATFPVIPMTAGTTYHLHFTMNSGSNLGGDASHGLVYYKSIDSVTTSNNSYGVLYPDILTAFNYHPTAADAAQGGTLLPMMRLVFSGSSTFLPVKLINLSAVRTPDGAVRIGWKTSAEGNVYDYEVNRITSSDGIVAGSVHAENASHGASYAVLDAAAPKNAVSYDLIERDLDGSRQSLGRVEVAAVTDLTQPLAISAYPNPATNRLTISSNRAFQTVSILDPLGRVVRTVVSSGERLDLYLDLTGLSSGTYFIQATSGQDIGRIMISVNR